MLRKKTYVSVFILSSPFSLTVNEGMYLLTQIRHHHGFDIPKDRQKNRLHFS